jgi:hypothetical protein
MSIATSLEDDFWPIGVPRPPRGEDRPWDDGAPVVPFESEVEAPRTDAAEARAAALLQALERVWGPAA